MFCLLHIVSANSIYMKKKKAEWTKYGNNIYEIFWEINVFLWNVYIL